MENGPEKKRTTQVNNAIIHGLEKTHENICSKHIQHIRTYPRGSLFLFRLKDSKQINKGGFIDNISDDDVLTYMLNNNVSDGEIFHSVNLNDIDTCWVIDSKKISLSSRQFTAQPVTAITNFPLYIKDIVIFYGKDNFARSKYITTEKYKKQLRWYNHYG
jgi:hypothetical protein